jgi:signal transduction histidine kinase
MKSSFKYIFLLVILSLSGIFAYQLFWITSLYHAREKENKEIIVRAIQDADHIELFSRIDFISSHTNKQRETSAFADTKGNFGLSTQFPKQDSIHRSNYSFLPLDTPVYQNKSFDKETQQMLKSTNIKVGDDYASLGRLGLQMQQSLHELIDQKGMPIRIAMFDSILNNHLMKSGLDIRHFTQIIDLQDSTVIASSVPESTDLLDYERYKWKYTTYHPRAYYVYATPTHGATLRMMTGILLSSLLILIILTVSFAYMIWFLMHQKTVEQLKDDFTHNVTHELKTPIAITYAAIEAIIHYNLTENKEKANKYLHICHEELQHLSCMVEQILSLSQERKKDFKLKFETVCLNEVIDKIIEQQPIKSTRPFLVETEFSPASVSLETDRMHIYNIISNLLDNAVKYCNSQPVVRITAQATDHFVTIRISDNGIGISEEHQKHIFDKFYRIPNEGKVTVKGYGIGLFYVRTMVEKLNGTIVVASIPEKGSHFTITLPQKHEK